MVVIPPLLAMKHLITTRLRSSGVSFCEMIVCVAIIGIVATMAVPLFGNTKSIQQATNQRNAQTLCMLYSAADAAGVKIVQQGFTKFDVIRALKNGVMVESGAFKGRMFALPNLGEDELNLAAQYLELRDGQLCYHATAGSQDG